MNSAIASTWRNIRRRMRLDVLCMIVIAMSFGRALSAQPSEVPLSVPFGLPAVHHGSADFGDMEGDGDLDLAIAGMTAGGPILSLWQVGDTTWSPGGNVVYTVSVFRRTTVAAPPVSHGEVRWGDFDGDGDDDLLVTGLTDFDLGTPSDHQPLLNVYENNGVRAQLGGRSLSVRRIELPGLYRSATDWGDFDGDGDLDFAAAGLPSLNADEPVTWIYRTVGGTFVRDEEALPGVHSGDVAWADYDGDGDLDLALMGDSGGGNFISRIYRNDDGKFTNSGIELPGLSFGALDWGDYDADGDADLLISGGQLDPHFIRGVTKVYRNDGGTLIDSGFDFAGHTLGTARWGDADRDGDLDVFVVGAPVALRASVLRLYASDGSGFIPSWEYTGVRFAAMAVGDYNGDGDADVFIAGELTIGGLNARFLMNRDYFECVLPSWVRPGEPVGQC